MTTCPKDERLELEAARILDTSIRVDHTKAAKLLKIASSQDSKNKLDSYLLKFERFARANGWEEECWAGTLRALLTYTPGYQKRQPWITSN